MSKSVAARYRDLDYKGRCAVTYIWVDDWLQLRSKTRVFEAEPQTVADVPAWNVGWLDDFTAVPRDSDWALVPGALFSDPFRGDPHKLLFCDIRSYEGVPRPNNYRPKCLEIMEMAAAEKPWFGVEQEYYVMDSDAPDNLVYSWPKTKEYKVERLPHFHGTGINNVMFRDFADAHLAACANAGVKIFGECAEAWPSQFEYQIGPCEGASIGDHLWISRYILQRVAEDFGVTVTLHPKPVSSFGGSGGHVSFSTETMRSDGGIDAINDAVEKLRKRHDFHMKCYDREGTNVQRMTGSCQTASYDTFAHGVGDRSTAIRIPFQVALDGKGYLEDRRPPADVEPFMAAAALTATICLGSEDDEIFA